MKILLMCDTSASLQLYESTVASCTCADQRHVQYKESGDVCSYIFTYIFHSSAVNNRVAGTYFDSSVSPSTPVRDASVVLT